jgi:putative ABC transport system substrate-binding protein
MTLDRGETARWVAESERAAHELGLEIYPMDVHSVSPLDALFSEAAEQGVEGLLVFRNLTVVTFDRRVINLAERYRMPAIFDARDFVDVGAFMSYGPNLEKLFRKLASYLGHIFRGTKPSELPIEQSTEFELVINLKTAKALGITVPNTVLVSAHHLVE